MRELTSLDHYKAGMRVWVFPDSSRRGGNGVITRVNRATVPGEETTVHVMLDESGISVVIDRRQLIRALD